MSNDDRIAALEILVKDLQSGTRLLLEGFKILEDGIEREKRRSGAFMRMIGVLAACLGADKGLIIEWVRAADDGVDPDEEDGPTERLMDALRVQRRGRR